VAPIKKDVTLGCLRHYVRENRQQRVARLASFTGVTQITVNTWFRETPITPVGPVMMRLRVYLDVVGYEVLEFTDVPEILRDLIRLGALGVVSFSEIARELGYISSNLYTMLFGKTGISEERLQLAEALVQIHRRKLDASLMVLKESIAERESRDPKEQLPEVRNKVKATLPLHTAKRKDAVGHAGKDQTGCIEVDDLIKLVSHMILAAYPLVDALEKRSQASDREHLRSLTGDRMRLLANRLHRLAGGEMARAELQRTK